MVLIRAHRAAVAVLAAGLALAGCGAADDEVAVRQPVAPEEPGPSVFTPMTDTLERAAGVEDTLRDAAAERRRQLEAAE